MTVSCLLTHASINKFDYILFPIFGANMTEAPSTPKPSDTPKPAAKPSSRPLAFHDRADVRKNQIGVHVLFV
jgi:hypothetical protein